MGTEIIKGQDLPVSIAEKYFYITIRDNNAQPLRRRLFVLPPWIIGNCLLLYKCIQE